MVDQRFGSLVGCSPGIVQHELTPKHFSLATALRLVPTKRQSIARVCASPPKEFRLAFEDSAAGFLSTRPNQDRRKPVVLPLHK